MELQNILGKALLQKIAEQSAQKEGIDAEVGSPPQQKAQQQAQQKAQTSTQNSLFSAFANSNPALSDILKNVLQNNTPVDKFALQAQTAIDKAAIFAKLTEELLKQLDNLPLLPKEKEFTEALFKEIENIIRKISPSSPIIQLAENLPKTASIENIYKWATIQIKDGNLPIRDLFALPQILLGKADSVVEPTTYSSSSPAQISNPVVYAPASSAIPVANTNMNTNIMPNTNPAPISVLQNDTNPAPILVPQNDTNPAPISVSQNNQTANIGVSTPAVPVFSQNSPKTNIEISVSPAASSQNNQTADFTLPTNIEKQNNIEKPNTATILEKPEATPITENPNKIPIAAVNSNPIQNAIHIAETPNAAPIIEKPNLIYVNNFSLSAPSQKPKDILFIQQTNANFKENIQNLIPQIQNENIKNLLNEIVMKILPEKDNAAFAFVKVDGKNDFVKFLPLTLQTQFNSEFSAVLSKNFPELSKELLLDTANIIRNGEKPIIISQNVLKNVENILKAVNSNVSAEPQIKTQTEPPVAAQWKITAPILSSLLQYAAEPNKNEAILQNLKTIFIAEKNIENISSNIKNFVESFENIDKKNVEKLPEKHNLISKELTKSVEKLNNLEKVLKNAEVIFKKENSIEYLMEKIGILQKKPQELREQQPKIEENLRSILREISQQIKISSQKLQNLPALQNDNKLDDAFSKLKTLSNSVNELSRKIDAANLLANKVDISVGRSEQTVLVPVQIGNAWIQMEFRINKDDKNKRNKGRKQAEQVELNVELDKGNSVWAKANLTLEKQLQVSINFTDEKMLIWFKQNYKEFCEALESIGTKSVRVIFNREKNEEERKEKNEIIKSNFDITG